MAGVAALRRKERIFGQCDAHCRDALAVDAQKLGILGAVARGERLWDGRAVGKAEVNEPLLSVAQQRF